MIREIREEELERGKNQSDTEFTLGPGMLLGLGCGLVLLCGICFGLGYSIGHRSSPEPVVANASAASKTPFAPQGVGATSKPTASGQIPVQPQSQTASTSPTDPSGAEVRGPEIVAAAKEVSATPAQAQVRQTYPSEVRPALAIQASGQQLNQPMQVQPALSQPSGWMVQIAAVSHPADAEVLVNALRRRGYAVAVRRDVADNLLHVQVGPFANRNDANVMRQKLLNDGYNAIVQQ